MADSKEYYTQKAENGSIQISEDVVAESVTGLCVGRVNVNICGIALPREAKK